MRIDNPTKEELRKYNDNLQNYIESNYSLVKTLYLDLGVKVVRLLCFSEEFLPHIKKQLDFVLLENAGKYDVTIVLWKENNISQIHRKIIPNNLRLRVELLACRDEVVNLQVYSNDFSVSKPVLSVEGWHNIVNSYSEEKETYFYGVENLETEKFMEEGHLFFQIFNNILKTKSTNMVHGACIGLDNNGILLCARGARGKSTLSVLALTEGFDYVSDDYLTLEKDKDKDNLYAYPIYSIITLSPRMYNELYNKLEGTRFISNNARKDKYVINISNFHEKFKKKYPIKLCMFPEIVSDKQPCINECSIKEKGRAITHIIHSTIFQMNDHNDIKTVKKLIDMLKKFKFYKIYLCNDIYKNVECLRKFLKEYKNV